MPDRLATQLLRIARDPVSGRLRNPGPLAIGLRAALFTDLVLAGRISHERPGPVVGPVPDETGDRILDAVARAVDGRPGVAWWRWYRHVAVDRTALIDELVADGRWQVSAQALRGDAYAETDADGAQELTHRTLTVVEAGVPPADARQAVLAALTVMCGSIVGRPRPRSLRSDLKPLVVAAARSGERGAEVLPAVLNGASQLMKRPLRRAG